MERAAHVTMTLYAIHQQANQETCVHRLRAGFGLACALLKADPHTGAKGVDRRFAAIQTSSSWVETATHARGLVQLMRAAASPISFDYAQFAQDLINLRDPDRANVVRLRWGRDFVRAFPSSDTATAGNPEP